MGILAMGAGAAEGLNQLLARLLNEEKVRQSQEQISETGRHNLATEGQASRALDINDAYRRDNLSTQSQDRALTRADTERRDQNTDLEKKATLQKSIVSMRPIGSNVTPEEATADAGIGVSRGSYGEFDPGNMGADLQEGGTLPAKPAGMAWKGTQDQIVKAQEAQTRADKPQTETSAQIHTVLYKGKPVDASYNPKTQKLTYQGQDITTEAQHYEKPPAPDRVLVQSGDSYIPRSQAAGAPLATTSSTRTMEEGAKMLRPHITRLEQTADELDKRGLFGPVMSRIRETLTKVGSLEEFQQAVAKDPQLSTDRLVGQFATSLGLLATGAGRVHGGARGGGSPQMLDHFKSLLSDASSLNMFKGRLDSLDEYMGGYAAGPNADAGHAAGGDSGLPTIGGTFNGGKVLKVTPIQ